MSNRSFLSKAFVAALLVATLFPLPALAADSEGSDIFIAGFNAYQKKDYATAVHDMRTLLHKYPDSSMRDMALLWLAKGYFKKGDRVEGAKFMAQFLKDYPESPLTATVDQEMRDLAALYAKGEPLPPPRPAENAPAPKPPAAPVAPSASANQAAPQKIADPTVKSTPSSP